MTAYWRWHGKETVLAYVTEEKCPGVASDRYWNMSKAEVQAVLNTTPDRGVCLFDEDQEKNLIGFQGFHALFGQCRQHYPPHRFTATHLALMWRDMT